MASAASDSTPRVTDASRPAVSKKGAPQAKRRFSAPAPPSSKHRRVSQSSAKTLPVIALRQTSSSQTAESVNTANDVVKILFNIENNLDRWERLYNSGKVSSTLLELKEQASTCMRCLIRLPIRPLTPSSELTSFTGPKPNQPKAKKFFGELRKLPKSQNVAEWSIESILGYGIIVLRLLEDFNRCHYAEPE